MTRELEQIEELRKAGKSEEALNIIKNLEKKKGLAGEDLLSVLLLKSTLLLDLQAQGPEISLL